MLIAAGSAAFARLPVGMWRDVAWHRRLTDEIRKGPIEPALRSG
jgi:hypothetical protein